MPFSIINDINAGREPESLKNYNPFITNRFFSFFPDTLYYAQMMNLNYDLEPKAQFLFFLNTVRPSKRWQKWLKKEQTEDYDLVREYYGFSDRKAKEALTILTNDQLDVIKRRLKKDV